MFWSNFLSIHRSPTLAIAKWLVYALRQDADRFLRRYPVLFMSPDQACRAAMKRVLEKFPEHIPIAAKLAFAITLLLTLGMLGLGILIGTNQSRLLDNQISLLGDMVAKQLGDSATEPLLANDMTRLESLSRNALNQEKIVGLAFISDDLQIAAGSGAVPPDFRSQKSPAFAIDQDGGSISWANHAESGEQPIISFIRPIRHRNAIIGHILLSFDRSALATAKKQTVRMVSTTTIMMIGLGILASFMLASWLTRPINELVRFSRSIENGNYDIDLPRGRRNDEIGILLRSMNIMGQGLLKKEQVERVFSRYVSENVAKQVLKDLEHREHAPLGCEHVQASVVFADIVGFTTLSELASPKEISELLNLYFSYIAKAVRFCNGHIDKYIGDCAMIVFGVPERSRDHAYHAVACAWMIRQLIERVNQRRIAQSKNPVQLRIGINSGIMVAGNMGSEDRMNYTVVGDAVNIASRLSHAGDPGEIIITEEVLFKENLNSRVQTEFVDTIPIRGRKQLVSIVRVTNIDARSRSKILREIDRLLRIDLAESG
ncbi:MAG: adenylate/guanylate cyclase domain-containing protein [Methylococcales bacterium]